MFTNDNSESIINLRNRTIRLDREGDCWTDDEKEILRQKFYNGDGITEMALALQRTESAIMQQIEAQDLYGRKKKASIPRQPMCLCSNCKLTPSHCPRCIAVNGCEK